MERIYVRNKIVMFVNGFRTIDGNLQKIDEKMTLITKKEFLESLEEDEQKGIKHEIEYVSKKPDKFQFNKIYILQNSGKKPDYIYVYISLDT